MPTSREALNGAPKVLSAITTVLIAVMASASRVDNPFALWNASEVAAPDTSGTFTRLVDATGNGHDLALGGALQPAASDDSLRGKVFGANGYGGTYATGSLPAMTRFTLSIWFNRYNGNGQYGQADSDPQYLVNNFNGFAVTSPYDGKTWNVSVGGTDTGVKMHVPRAEWHHMVVTFADDVVSAYVDGELVDSKSGISASGSTGDLVLANQGTWNKHAFYGLLDEMRIYDVALTADEVAELYAKTHRLGLVARWPMDKVEVVGGERQVANTVDPSNPLVLGDAVTAVDGLFGGALFFDAPANDGATVYANVAAISKKAPVSIGGDFTFMMWMKRDRKQSTTNGPRFLTFFTDANYQEFVSPNNGTGVGLETALTGSWVTYNMLARNEEWSHLAWSWETSLVADENGAVSKVRRVRCYRNGELVQTTDWTTEQSSIDIPLSGGKVIVGNSKALTRPLRGTVEDVRVYRGKMTPEDVRRIYRGPAAVTAGDDFTVRGSVAELHGTVSPYAAGKLSRGYAGEPSWSLVSAPQGGGICRNRQSQGRGNEGVVAGRGELRLSLQQHGRGSDCLGRGDGDARRGDGECRADAGALGEGRGWALRRGDGGRDGR